MSGTNRSGPSALRRILAGDGITLVPGAFDVLSARLIADKGFRAITLGGSALAATQHGLADTGLMTSTEIVSIATRVAEAVDIPVICDADAGYGNPVNVMRHVQTSERGGIAGIHLEDEVFPRTRYTAPNRQLCTIDEMRARLNAAQRARQDPDFVIIARTDARAGRDFEEVLARLDAIADAGADVLYAEHLTSAEEFAEVGRRFGRRLPLYANMSEFARYPLLTATDLAAMGYRLMAFPLTLLRASLQAITRVLDEITASGSQAAVLNLLGDAETLHRLTRTSEAMDLERELLPRVQAD